MIDLDRKEDGCWLLTQHDGPGTMRWNTTLTHEEMVEVVRRYYELEHG
jgi:hypothetical protein